MKKNKQIKFRSKDVGGDNQGNNNHHHHNHSRSISDYGVMIKGSSGMKEITDNLGELQELSGSQSQPHTHNKNMPSNISIKSSVSSHQSSISSAPSSSPSDGDNNENNDMDCDDGDVIAHTDSNVSYQSNVSNVSNHSYSSVEDQDLNQELKVINANERHRRSSSVPGKTYMVTNTGHLDIPSKVPDTGGK
eukprot:UN03671